MISTSYFCAVPLLEDVRALDHIGQAKVCEAFAKWLDRNPNVDSMFIERFRETFDNIDHDKPDESVEFIHYAVNDLDSALTFIDYHSPMDFLDVVGILSPRDCGSESWPRPVKLVGVSVWKFLGDFFEDVVTGGSKHRSLLSLSPA